MAKPPTVTSFWNIYAGDDSTIRIVFLEKDLSGYSNWRASWRPTWDSKTAYEFGVIVSGDTVTLHIPGDASEYPTGVVRSGVWDLQAESNGKVHTLIRGKINWIGDVTR